MGSDFASWFFGNVIWLSAVAIYLALLLVVPVALGYAVYRPYDRHLIWLKDASRYNAESAVRRSYEDAARTYQKTRAQRGSILAIIVACMAFVWAVFVITNWDLVGQQMRAFILSE